MSENRRILGLDFGSKTVGVAVSDPLLLTAQGLEIVRREKPGKLRRTLSRIEEIVKEYDVDRIVLGYPKNMNNTEGERCERTKEFAKMLTQRLNLPVELWDERLTTVAADAVMRETGVRREERKDYVDEIARRMQVVPMRFILNSYPYLDFDFAHIASLVDCLVPSNCIGVLSYRCSKGDDSSWMQEPVYGIDYTKRDQARSCIL